MLASAPGWQPLISFNHSGKVLAKSDPGALVRILVSMLWAPKSTGWSRNCETYGPVVQPGYGSRNSVCGVTWPPIFGPRKSESWDRSAAALIAVALVAY